jgi:acetyl esterase/lipase
LITEAGLVRVAGMSTRLFTGVGAVAAAVLVAAVPAGATGTRPGAARGDLRSTIRVADLDRDQVAAMLAEVPFDNPQVRYGVQAYRIEYRTVDVHGRPITASALVALPARRPGPASAVVWEHGTRVGRADVGSMSGDNLDRPAAVLFATAGFVTVAPDYLGLGTGPGYHPYGHAATEATASLDALRAGRTLAAQHRQWLSGDVLVSGFSQGGQAAMAAGQAIAHAPGLRLRALAAISGAFDLAGTEVPALFDGRVDPSAGAFYLTYWTLASNRTYGLFTSPSDVFRAPYDRTLPPLFDGNHDEMTIFPALPPSPQDLITARYAAWLRSPTGALRRALAESSATCQWRPGVPVRLYAASADREVPIGNTNTCVAQLRRHHTHPVVIDLGDVAHLDTPVVALPDVVDWFLHEH